MKKVFLKGLLDGAVSGLIMYCIGTILFIPYNINISPMLIGLLGAICSAVVYVFLVRDVTTNSQLLCCTIFGILSFPIVFVTILMINVTIPLNLFLSHNSDSNNANSIMLLIIYGCYVIGMLCLKICSLIIFVARNV